MNCYSVCFRKNWIWYSQWSLGIQAAICFCTQRLFQWRTVFEEYAWGTLILPFHVFSILLVNTTKTMTKFKVCNSLSSFIKVALRWLGGIYWLVTGNLTLNVQLAWNHAMREASMVVRWIAVLLCYYDSGTLHILYLSFLSLEYKWTKISVKIKFQLWNRKMNSKLRMLFVTSHL